MKRKSPPKYDNAVGCVLLWTAVTKPDRRTAMKWLRAAMRERNRKTARPAPSTTGICAAFLSK